MAIQLLGLAMASSGGSTEDAPAQSTEVGAELAAEGAESQTLPYSTTDKDLFPCLLVCGGSGAVFFVVGYIVTSCFCYVTVATE